MSPSVPVHVTTLGESHWYEYVSTNLVTFVHTCGISMITDHRRWPPRQASSKTNCYLHGKTRVTLYIIVYRGFKSKYAWPMYIGKRQLQTVSKGQTCLKQVPGKVDTNACKLAQTSGGHRLWRSLLCNKGDIMVTHAEMHSLLVEAASMFSIGCLTNLLFDAVAKQC